MHDSGESFALNHGVTTMRILSNHLHGDAFKFMLMGIMTYEQLAFSSRGKIPTITNLSRRTKRILGLTIVGILTAHFLTDGEDGNT